MILSTEKAVELAKMLGEASYASASFNQKATDARSKACCIDYYTTTVVVIRLHNADCIDPATLKQLAEGFAVAGLCDRRTDANETVYEV